MHPKSRGASPWLQAVGIGGAAAMAVTLALCMIAAALIAGGLIPLDAAGGIAIAICLCASWGGALLGAKRAGEKKLPAAMAAAGVYLLLMLTVKGLAFRGAFTHAAYLIPAAALGGALAGLMAARKKRRRR